MKYAVIYQSKSGNTRLIAEQIYFWIKSRWYPIDFMRLFFSGAFKDNRNLSYGFLTGILRIAQESIFSGLNNLSVNSIMDEDYSQFFGFTSSEVYEMLQMLSGRLMKNVMMQN